MKAALSRTRQLPKSAKEVRSRLSAPLPQGEFFSLALAMGIMVMFAVLYRNGYWETIFDYENYRNAAYGNFSIYFYPYWLVPIFKFLSWFPFLTGYIIWTFFNILAVWVAARILGGHRVALLLSYQMFYAIGYGQIVGFVLLGLALFWSFAVQGKWYKAGIGLLMAATKYQSSLLMAAVLFWFVPGTWRDKLKALLIPSLVAIISLVVEPTWALELIERIQTSPPNDFGSISLWQYFGPWALILLVPALILPSERKTKILFLLTTIPLVVPYFQQSDLLILFAFPIAWPFVVLGNWGYMMVLMGWEALKYLWIMPLSLYMYLLVTEWQTRRSKPDATTPPE